MAVLDEERRNQIEATALMVIKNRSSSNRSTTGKNSVSCVNQYAKDWERGKGKASGEVHERQFGRASYDNITKILQNSIKSCHCYNRF